MLSNDEGKQQSDSVEISCRLPYISKYLHHWKPLREFKELLTLSGVECYFLRRKKVNLGVTFTDPLIASDARPTMI